MPWTARRQNLEKPLDTGNRDYYYVDGSPSVADAWLYTDYTAAARWPTAASGAPCWWAACARAA